MILTALNQYYETLCARGELSVPGWNDGFKVSFGLDLSDTGEITRVIDLREEKELRKKKVITPRLMRVPSHPTRTSGTIANFLCDNSSYMLGIDADGINDKTTKCFTANRTLHEKLLSSVDHPAAQAILSFFQTWHPEDAEITPSLSTYWEKILSGVNLIFCYEGSPVSELECIQDAWQAYYDAPNPFALKGLCLITGDTGAIAATHPQIKGVKDAQPTGAALVSFNSPALCSYGHKQNFNAPISDRAAFAYTTALNTLLSDRAHCRVIGDTTLVCWAEHGDINYPDAYMAALFGSPETGPESALSAFFTQLSKGEPVEWVGNLLDENEHFYILGLSPNAARLSVRFFLEDSFGSVLRNIKKHYEDIAIVAPAYDPWDNLPLWKLLSETVNDKSMNKNPSPKLSGEVLRTILTGAPYPVSLLYGVQLRIRAEHNISRGQAAIIKAYYTRANTPFPKEVLTMEGNPASTNIPYTLGRLFSVYEQIQERALPGLNSTIKDKFFNSASGTPAAIFPILGNLSQKHLRKLRGTSRGSAIYFENMVGNLSRLIGENYPIRLSLPDQGAFQLGYYYENQERYKPKNNKVMEE